MNPTYVPLAQYAATPIVPLYRPDYILLITGIAFAFFALPLVIYIVRWSRFLVAAKVNGVERRAPGLIHTFLVIVTVPIMLASGYLFAFGLAAWHFDGGYACSAENPVVAPRVGLHEKDNLCFDWSSRADAQAKGMARGAAAAASAGIDVINGGQR
ncbi:hypothetical protein [Burkholderia vietnamiensis]|uniref:hypothetical protein n=1 Tax=Burkholderia vietnamiensis TaxID=60552 RepID=UPI001CF2F921|nr:hypothetical protein [Burkholderia vietnamiensis]MCA8448855.1 hypothetical protein [Burkholderia vietnamiensis]